MMQSESVAKLSAALVAAQEDIRAVEKSATNPHFKSKYVPLDAIIAMARPALARHGIAIAQAGTPFDDGKGLLVETRLVHTSGEWLSGVVYIPFGKADPQGAGAAMTYGRRFGLSALLSISSEDDDDGNSASQRSEGKGRAAPRSTATGATSAASESRPRATAQPSADLMPFGKSKGTPIVDMPLAALQGAVKWARDNKPDQYAQFITDADRLIGAKMLDLEPVGA